MPMPMPMPKPAHARRPLFGLLSSDGVRTTLLALLLLAGPAPERADAQSQSRPTTLRVAGARLEVSFEGGVDRSERRRLLTWVRESAETIATYFGRYPVRTLQVELNVNSGSRVGFGQHFRGRRVRVRVGRNTTDEQLARDWVLRHEMAHVAFPMLANRHRWMREGLSTYLESIMLARENRITEERVWERFVQKMPNGLPGRRDRGLDHTRSWGALYWGGALFWMVADVRLRSATRGRASVQSIVQGILARGGNARVRWTTAEVVRVADELSGTTVLSDLYAEMAAQRGTVDLDAFFGRLGVVETDDGIRLHDTAPLARLRQAITATR